MLGWILTLLINPVSLAQTAKGSNVTWASCTELTNSPPNGGVKRNATTLSLIIAAGNLRSVRDKLIQLKVTLPGQSFSTNNLGAVSSKRPIQVSPHHTPLCLISSMTRTAAMNFDSRRTYSLLFIIQVRGEHNPPPIASDPT